MRRDVIKRSLVTASGVAIIAYLFWLYNAGSVIVQGEFSDYNMAAYIVLGIVALYYLIVYGVYPIHIKWHKRMFLVIGLGLILAAHVYLLDDASKGIYIADFIKLIGVLLVLFGATGYLIPQKSRKKQEEADIEVIEV